MVFNHSTQLGNAVERTEANTRTLEQTIEK
jgi:hypothetical protein